jgi:alginate O-acetyltransferase complex protein AlgI
MLFSSTIFLFAFLPIVLSTYFLLRSVASRNVLLVVVSLLFYAWGETGYVALLLVSIAANFGFGRWVAAVQARSSRLRRTAVTVAVAANLLLLASFKYANFAAESLNPALLALGLPAIELAPVHLPIGISFFTFQALTYVVDIHRGQATVQRNPLHVALYISLFPQLIAGPIVRYHQIASQLRNRVSTLDDVASGARRFTVGLGKKVLIANTLAGPADQIFSLSPDELQAPVAWLGAICFSLQIYFDFSGYSDMAIGLGRIFGFRFPENFRYPYTSRTVREFWRRWHITLSTWFRDYLYIPLGGSRVAPARIYANLLAVFLLCGLWHGASWSFVVWGLIHGTFIVSERAGLARLLERLPAALGIVYTLGSVTLAWIFFRAEDLGHAVGFLQAMFSPGAATASPQVLPLYLDSRISWALGLAALGSTPWLPALERWMSETPLAPVFRTGRLLGCNCVLIASALAIASGTHNPFIYFRF